MSPAHPEHPSRTITCRHIIELSHTIHPLAPYWPGEPATTFAVVADVSSFLLDERRIRGLGIDIHGADEDDTFSANRLVLERGGIVLENLAHLEQLPLLGSAVVIGRLRLEGGSVSPVAVIDLVP